MDSRVRFLSGGGAMAKDERRGGKRTSKPANDNGLARDGSFGQFRTALIPLVRLLARQAARDWHEKATNDNQSETRKELPKEE